MHIYLLFFRYLLEVCQPDTGAVGAALGSLIRIARHSPEAAERIAKCPRLCSFIVTEYLPMFGWNTPRLLHGTCIIRFVGFFVNEHATT